MKIFLILLLCQPMISFASPKIYVPEIIPGPNIGIRFQIPYSLGTHEGDVRIISGEVKIDTDNPSAASGEFRVPIESLTTNKAERDCHLRESLGLNYQVSDFPKEHVCNGQFNLPPSGKNAVVYPLIIFKILAINSLDSSKKILLDRETQIKVEGQWIIHGAMNLVKFPMKIISIGNKLRITGEVPFSLNSYGIIVKPARMAFFTIGVKDQAKVIFDLLLTPNPS